jgi:hypothetical protein
VLSLLPVAIHWLLSRRSSARHRSKVDAET